jgi:hypothetical protein
VLPIFFFFFLVLVHKNVFVFQTAFLFFFICEKEKKKRSKKLHISTSFPCTTNRTRAPRTAKMTETEIALSADDYGLGWSSFSIALALTTAGLSQDAPGATAAAAAGPDVHAAWLKTKRGWPLCAHRFELTQLVHSIQQLCQIIPEGAVCPRCIFLWINLQRSSGTSTSEFINPAVRVLARTVCIDDRLRDWTRASLWKTALGTKEAAKQKGADEQLVTLVINMAPEWHQFVTKLSSKMSRDNGGGVFSAAGTKWILDTSQAFAERCAEPYNWLLEHALRTNVLEEAQYFVSGESALPWRDVCVAVDGMTEDDNEVLNEMLEHTQQSPLGCGDLNWFSLLFPLVVAVRFSDTEPRRQLHPHVLPSAPPPPVAVAAAAGGDDDDEMTFGNAVSSMFSRLLLGKRLPAPPPLRDDDDDDCDGGEI